MMLIALILCLLACSKMGGSNSLGCEDRLSSYIKLQWLKDSMDELKEIIPISRDDKEDVNGCSYSDQVSGYLHYVTELWKEMKHDLEKDNLKECPKCRDSKDSKKRLGSNEEELGSDKSRPVDCAELYQMGKKKSGEYTIYPRSRRSKTKSMSVYCDMETDGGGWTVIQRRGKYSEETNFERNWQEYKKGFGSVKRDFWLGNENIFTLTSQAGYVLRIDLINDAGTSKYSQHQSFWIGDEHSNYVLHVSEFSGTATNGMQIHDKMPFSTHDHPNDNKPETLHCARLHSGAWWYPKAGCGYVNLNGIYMSGIHNPKSNWWYLWTGFTGLKHSEMKIRPRYPFLDKDWKP